MKDKTDLRDPMGVQLEPADKTTRMLIRSCLYALIFAALMMAFIIVSFHFSYNGILWK